MRKFLAVSAAFVTTATAITTTATATATAITTTSLMLTSAASTSHILRNIKNRISTQKQSMTLELGRGKPQPLIMAMVTASKSSLNLQWSSTSTRKGQGRPLQGRYDEFSHKLDLTTCIQHKTRQRFGCYTGTSTRTTCNNDHGWSYSSSSSAMVLTGEEICMMMPHHHSKHVGKKRGGLLFVNWGVFHRHKRKHLKTHEQHLKTHEQHLQSHEQQLKSHEQQLKSQQKTHSHDDNDRQGQIMHSAMMQQDNIKVVDDILSSFAIEDKSYSFDGTMYSILLTHNKSIIQNANAPNNNDYDKINNQTDLGKSTATISRLPKDDNTNNDNNNTNNKNNNIDESLAHRWSRSLFEDNIIKLLHRWSSEPPLNLHIRAYPHNNVLNAFLFQGQIGSDMKITFDALRFDNLQISGGGRLDITQMQMNILRFVPPKLADLLHFMHYGPETKGRFASQFEFHAKHCVMTNIDLLRSSCIRNGLENLLRRILNRFDYFIENTEIKVRSVKILPTGKISVKGVATTIFGNRVPFEVRSMIQISSRGHIIEFPGLEVALNWSLNSPHPQTNHNIDNNNDSETKISSPSKFLFPPIFLPVHPQISVDIGNDFRFEYLHVNGEDRLLEFSARAKISPIPKNRFNLKYVQRKGSYLAPFHCDAAKWLTDIGNFTK